MAQCYGLGLVSEFCYAELGRSSISELLSLLEIANDLL